MLNRNSLIISLFFAVTLLSCSSKFYYEKGLKAAQNPTSASVYNQLTEVTPANKDLTWKTINGKQYVLAVTWKADTSYYTKKDSFDPSTGMYQYNTHDRPIFITMSPYLKNEPLGKLSDAKLSARLCQILGLPPNSNYSYFLEVWVRPEDLFRPCFDPATNVNVCELIPSKQDNSRADYLCWLYTYIYNSYCATDVMSRYPFSHLGYTYDWSHKNKSHVGLSEFVIGENKDVYIKKIYTTEGYFQ